jgi:hypothetical protein
VLAAAAAIRRTLAAEGSDIHAFADALCRPQPQRKEEPRRPPPHEGDWHSMACECQAHSERLSEREQGFVDDMVEWTAFGEPTEKQQGSSPWMNCRSPKPSTATSPTCRWRSSGSRPNRDG